MSRNRINGFRLPEKSCRVARINQVQICACGQGSFDFFAGYDVVWLWCGIEYCFLVLLHASLNLTTSRYPCSDPAIQNGDSFMPRVQGRGSGASERLVVSPGREEDGILHMPGGQSGHPLSPYFLKGHMDWVEGKATPLLPGPAEHRLELVPAD